MARRLGTWLLGSAALSLGALSSLSGCYSHHTADEDKLDIDFPDGSYDAGVVVVTDAGPVKSDAGNCGAPGTIQSFLCGLMGGTGGTTPATGTGGTGTPSIADILNGTQDPAAFGDLLGALTGMGTTGGSSLTDLLAGLGIPTTGGRAPTMPTTPTTRPTTPTTPGARDAGAGRLGGFTTPTAADCANPTSQLTQLICSMQQGGRRDAGTPRPTTPPVVTPPVVTPPAVTPPVVTPPVEPVDAGAPVVTPPAEPVDAGAPVVTPPAEPVDAGAPVVTPPAEPVDAGAPVVPVEPAPVVPVDADAGVTI